MYNDMENKEIGVKPLLVQLLRKWRRILFWGILLDVLLGGGKLAQGILSWNSGMEVFNTDLEGYYDYCSWYDDEVASLEQKRDNYNDKAEEQQTYLDESVLMSMNAQSKMQASADVLVTLDSSVWSEQYGNSNYDPTDGLITLYANSVLNETDWDKVSSVSGVDREYVSELVSTTTDLESNVFTVTASHPNESTASAILEEVLSELTGRYESMAASVGTHTISTANKTTGRVYDQELSDYQKAAYDTLDTYRQKAEDCQNQINNLEAPAWPDSKPSRKQICFSALVFGILGFLLGMLIIICPCYISYVYGGKLHSEDELKELLGIRCLGAFTEHEEASEKKRAFARVDQWIDRFAGEEAPVSDDVMEQLITLNIQNHGEDAQKLFITGTVADTELQKIQEILTSRLPDMEITFGGAMNKDTTSYQSAMACDAIIFVEKKEESKLTDILQERDFAQSLGKEVIGCVLV